jgi:uroporphyrinogen-III synthase
LHEVHLYLQNKLPTTYKNTSARKRKIFVGERTAADLEPMIKKKEEKILVPCSNIRNNSIPDIMEKNKIELTEVQLFNRLYLRPIRLDGGILRYYLFL